MICVEVHFATSITPTNVLPSIYPSDGGWMHPSSRSNSPFYDAHERGNGDDTKTRKFINKTSFQQASFDRLCQYFIQKIYLNASKRLFFFFQRCLNSFLHEKELIKQRKIKQSQQMASTRAREKISQYVLEKQQRLEYLAATNPLLVAKEMKSDLLFNKFSKQLTRSAGTSANRGNESLDDSTLESLLGLPITSHSNVNKSGSAAGAVKPVMTPTTPAASSTPNGVAYEGSSGTMSNNLAESSSLKSNSRDMALNPANHHRGYSVSGNNTPLLNPTKPSSPPRHASVKPGDSQLPPRKARLPSVVKKSSVQYNGARHYSVTATSDDILGTLSNPSNDVRDNHYIHGSVLMPGMNPIGSNNANLSSFRNEISSILGVFEEEIHTLKQELETQKLNYFYSRGRLDLAYTPYEEEKTDLVAPRSRSGATPSSTTNTGKPLSEATNDTSQNNVNILMNSLSTSLPASARTSMLSGEGGRRENNTSPRASAAALEHENHQLKSELENMQKKLESFEASLQQTQQMTQQMEEQKLLQLQEQWQQNTHQLLQSTTETARQQLLQEFQELFQAKEEEMQSLQSQLALMEQKKPPGQRDRSISAEVMKFQLVEERLQHEYEEMMEQQKVLQAQIQQLMQEKQQAVHQPSKAGRRESVVGFEDLEEEEASPSKEFPGLGLSLFDYYRGSSNNTNKLMKSPRKVAETPKNQNGEELHMYRGDSTQAIKVTTNNKKPTNKKINSSTDTPMSSHRSAHLSVSGEVKPLAESIRESSELHSPTTAINNEEEVLISEDKVDEVLPTSAVEQPLLDSPSNFIPFGITAKSISRQFLLSPGSIKPPEISIVLSPKSDGKLREGDVTVTHNTTLNAPSSRPMTPKTPKSPKMPKNMGGGSGGGGGGGGGGGAPRGGRKLHPATAGTRSANAKKMTGVQLASSSMSRRAVAQQQQEKKGFSWFSFFFGKRATTPAPTEKDSSMHQSEAGESHMSGINLEQTNIFDLHESRDEEEEKRQKEEEEAKAREEARKREEERIYKNACILQKYMKQVTFLYSTASKSTLIYLRWRFLLPVVNSPELLAKRLEQEPDFLNQMISFSQEIIALIVEKLVQHFQGNKSSGGGRSDVWNVLDEQLLQFPLLIFLLIEGMMKKYEKMTIIYPFLTLSHFQQFVEQFLFLLIPLQYFLSSSSILPTRNRGGGVVVGSRLAAEAAENWNNLLKKYFNLMRIVYKIDLLKCMEDFTMMKQYMNFLLKGIHLFHSLGMKRCQQHSTDSLQDAQPFSLSMPITTTISEGSVNNGFDESEGSLSPRSRQKKEKKRVKDDGDIVIPPQLQELFQHLLIQVILLPVTSLEQIDIHHGKFIVLLFKLIEKHYDMASGKTGEGKRDEQYQQQPLVILPSENNNNLNSAAMTLRRQQEREKLFQSMYFLYFLDDLMTKYFLLVEDIHREEQEEASKTVPSPRKAWNKQQGGGAMMSVTTRSAEKEEKVVFANKQLHYCLKLFITLLHHASEEQKSYYFLLKFHEKYFYYLLHYYSKNWFLMTWYHKICQILIYLNITFITSPSLQSSSEMTGMVVKGYDMIQSHCLSGVFPSILMKLFLTLFQQYQYDFQQRRKAQQQQMQQQQTKYQPPPRIALPEEQVDAHSLSDVDKSSSTHHTPKQVQRVRSDYSALTSMPANDQIDFSTSLKVLASPSVKFASGGDDVSAGVGVSSPMSAMSGMSPKEKSNLIKKVNLQVNTRSINNEEIPSALNSPVQGTAVVNSTSVSTFPHLLTPTVAPTMNNNNPTQNNKLNYFLDYCKLLFSCYYQNEANLMKLYANGMIDMMTHVLDNLMQLFHQTLEETENEGRSVPSSVNDMNQLQEVCEYVYFLMVYCLNSIPTSTIASSQNHLLNASHQKIVMVIQKYSNHLFKSPPRRRSFIGEIEEKAALERRVSHQQTMQHMIEQMLNLYLSERKRNRGVIPSLPPTMTANGEVAGNFVYYRCGFKEMEAIVFME